MALMVLCGIGCTVACAVLLGCTQRSFSVDRIFIGALCLFSCLIFPIVFLAYSKGIAGGVFAENIININHITLMEYYASVLLIMLSCTCVFGRFRKETLNLFSVPVSDTTQNDNQIEWVSWCFLFIGIICSFLYYRVYGGYREYLNYSGMIRSGIFVVNNRFSFLIYFRNFTVLSTFLSFAKLLSEKRVRFRLVFLFCISLIYSIMTLYSNRGRVAFAFFFAVLVLYYLLRREKKSQIGIKMILAIAILIVLSLVGIYYAGILLGRNSDTGIVAELIEEVSFPFHNFANIAQYVDNGNYRFFKDGVIWPVYLLPTSIWNDRLGVRTASSITTSMTFGSVKGENGVTGAIPIDMVSVMYVQFGLLGVVFIAAIWCYWGCKILSWIDNNIHNKDMNLILKIYILIEYFLRSLIYCDPNHIVQRLFPFIAFMMMVFVWRRVFPRAILLQLRK